MCPRSPQGTAVRGMDEEFRKAYFDRGRRSVAPARMLKALLLQAPYSIQFEWGLRRRLKMNVLFRWFLDMSTVEQVLVPTVFTHNRERRALDRRWIGDPEPCLAQELEADRPGMRRRWGRRRPPVDRRRHATHRSSTDPEARLYRKGGTAANLSHSMPAMTEGRHGLVVAVEVGEANGRSKRECTLRMVTHVRRLHRMRVATLGADAFRDAEEHAAA